MLLRIITGIKFMATKKIKQPKDLPSQISNEFRRLNDLGFKVFSFNNLNSVSFGLKYFVHYIIVSKKYLVFIEIKNKNDPVSFDQKEFQLFISHLTSFNKSLHYYVVRSLNDCRKLIELLIKRKL